jgi:polyisoprenoid-binding protein YceI
MRLAVRTIRFAAVLFSLAALLVSGNIYAGPHIAGPNLKKKPTPPPPSAAKTDPGFDVGPDAMTNYQVDPTSSLNEIVFTSKAPKETIKGKTTKAVGNLDLNPRKLDSVAGSFTVHWADLDTGNPMRNQHMMGAPWVNAKSHPDIAFTVTGFELPKTPATPAKSDKSDKSDKSSHSIKGKLIGAMAMNGKEKQVKVPVTLAYVEAGNGKNGEKIKEGIGIKAKFKVNLEDFDIQGKGVGQAVAKSEQIIVSLFLAKSDGTAKKAEDGEKKDKKDKKKGDSEES